MFDSMTAGAELGADPGVGPEFTDRHVCADAIEANERAGVEQSCRRLVLAAEFADLYPAEGITERRVPGAETPSWPGGEGTPAVGGFAAAELAGLLGTTAGAASRLIGDALDLRHRLPLIWARVLRAEMPGHLARKVAQETHHLSQAAAALVDAEIVAKLGTLSFGRLMSCVEAAVLKVDPAGAAAEAEQALAERFVRLGRTSRLGLKLIVARAAAGDAIFFDAMIARLADILAQRGDSDPLDVRRSKALGILAQPAEAMRLLYEHSQPDAPSDAETETEPGTEPAAEDAEESAVTITPPPLDPAKARPRATIYVHLSEEALRSGTGVARMEDVGPVLLAQLRRLLGDLVDVRLQPVIDLNDRPAPVDAYEVPNRMREQLILNNPADRFPFAGGSARFADVDHTTAYRSPARGGPPGQTRVDKLAPLRRYHHRVRTHGSWQVRQPEAGVLVWRSPLGRVYLVDDTGTHRLGHGPFARAVWRAVNEGRAEELMRRVTA